MSESLIEARDLGESQMVMVYFEFDDLLHHQGRWESFGLEDMSDSTNEEYEEILYRVYGGRPLTVRHVYRPKVYHDAYVEFLNLKYTTQPWLVYGNPDESKFAEREWHELHR